MDASWPSPKQQIPLKNYSTFKIGGPADYLAEVRSIDHLLHCIDFAKKKALPYLVIGKGSNILFHDHGYKGLVIVNRISFKNQNGTDFEVGSGYSFALLGIQTARAGFRGLEFACGIPATLGGAVYMNAGSGGVETKDYLTSVCYLHHEGFIKEYKKEELCFAYRYSSFQDMPGGVILSARFTLVNDPHARKKQEEILQYRLRTQPYELPSIGCCFKNPSYDLASGKIIEDLKLKGCKIGGAMISPCHGNFIVNHKNAKAADVLALLEMVEDKVKKEYGIELHREIKIIPYGIQ